jgi:hypothetical protein
MCSQHSNTTNGARINEFQALGSSFSYLEFVQKMMNVGQNRCKYSRIDLLMGKSILNYLSISLLCEEMLAAGSQNTWEWHMGMFCKAANISLCYRKVKHLTRLWRSRGPNFQNSNSLQISRRIAGDTYIR